MNCSLRARFSASEREGRENSSGISGNRASREANSLFPGLACEASNLPHGGWQASAGILPGDPGDSGAGESARDDPMRTTQSLFFSPRHQPRQASGRHAGMSGGHLNEVRSPFRQVHRTWDRVQKSTEQESRDQLSFG